MMTPLVVQIFFVRWVSTDEFEGRTVRVDNQNRVVWSPATCFGKTVPTKVFAPPEFDILVSAAGAKCLRQRDALRDSLPPTVVRFVEFIRMIAATANEDRVWSFGWGRDLGTGDWTGDVAGGLYEQVNRYECMFTYKNMYIVYF